MGHMLSIYQVDSSGRSGKLHTVLIGEQVRKSLAGMGLPPRLSQVCQHIWHGQELPTGISAAGAFPRNGHLAGQEADCISPAQSDRLWCALLSPVPGSLATLHLRNCF